MVRLDKRGQPVKKDLKNFVYFWESYIIIRDIYKDIEALKIKTDGKYT